jgi:hypothetical protein
VIWSDLTNAKVHGILAEILPLIESIKAIWLDNAPWLCEFSQMVTTVLARARILKISRLEKGSFWLWLISSMYYKRV